MFATIISRAARRTLSARETQTFDDEASVDKFPFGFSSILSDLSMKNIVSLCRFAVALHC